MTVAAFGVVKRPNPQGTSILNDKSMRQLPFLSRTCAKTSGTRAKKDCGRNTSAQRKIVIPLQNQLKCFCSASPTIRFDRRGSDFWQSRCHFANFHSFGGLFLSVSIMLASCPGSRRQTVSSVYFSIYDPFAQTFADVAAVVVNKAIRSRSACDNACFVPWKPPTNVSSVIF